MNIYILHISAIGFIEILIITIIIFIVLIGIALLKSRKLNAEAKRLSKKIEEDNLKKKYQDFTEGHLYQNDKE